MEVPRTRSRCGLEDQTADFTGARGNDRMDALVVMGDVCLLVGADIRAAREVHRELEPVVAVERDALVGDLRLVHTPAVVEPRLAVEHERHLPPYDAHEPHQLMAVGRLTGDDRHEIADLSDAVRRQEPRHQDRRSWQVELLGHISVRLRPNREVTAPLHVEQRRKHARRVEPRTAEPVDRGISRYQRRRLQVADEAVVRDRWVGIHGRTLIPDHSGGFTPKG